MALALATAGELLDRPLIDDLTDPATGQLMPIFLVTDNGPCFKSSGFQRYIDSRPELRDIRTRRRSPQTNGVIAALPRRDQDRSLWRDLPADGVEMTAMVDDFRKLYNHVRPHETIAGAPDRALPRRPRHHPG